MPPTASSRTDTRSSKQPLSQAGLLRRHAADGRQSAARASVSGTQVYIQQPACDAGLPCAAARHRHRRLQPANLASGQLELPQLLHVPRRQRRRRPAGHNPRGRCCGCGHPVGTAAEQRITGGRKAPSACAGRPADAADGQLLSTELLVKGRDAGSPGRTWRPRQRLSCIPITGGRVRITPGRAHGRAPRRQVGPAPQRPADQPQPACDAGPAWLADLALAWQSRSLRGPLPSGSCCRESWRRPVRARSSSAFCSLQRGAAPSREGIRAEAERPNCPR